MSGEKQCDSGRIPTGVASLDLSTARRRKETVFEAEGTTGLRARGIHDQSRTTRPARCLVAIPEHTKDRGRSGRVGA